MASIFSKIITGEIPSYMIYENEHVCAFLDIHPLDLGHTLIVPKVEIDKFYEVPEPYYSAVFHAAKIIAPVLEKVMDSPRVFAKIIGTDVPHFHLHLIPQSQRYSGKPITVESDKMKAILHEIKKHMNRIIS